MSSPWKLGIDVGGTFTDAILYNANTGQVYGAKTPSTPIDQSVGVLNAIDSIKEQLSEAEEVKFACLNHGSTVATNAILEGKGANVALLVSEGYKFILQVRRSKVPGGLAGWMVWPKPEPLASLELTVEVPGRISTDGKVVRPFNVDVLRSRLSLLKQAPNPPQSICVSLINSFANAEHEQEVGKILLEEFPGVPVSLSSEILPEVMEYERTLTTVVNAYVKPQVALYLESLQKKIGETELRILRSDGGLATKDIAKNHCANLLYSGPAGGVAGVVAHVIGKTRYKNILTFDMGGTSTDVCLIQNGVPELRRETTVGDLTIRALSVDVRTVGAGGGSIASVAPITNALRVGPESSGAVPGPACYRKNGTQPTVTDANVVLGYLPTSLLGGTFALSKDAAYTAIEEHIAKPLGMTVLEAAEGIVRIAVERMYGRLRSVSIEKGKDPRDYQLCAFGGSGGIAVCALADLLESWPAIVPPSPGVLCALGDACTVVRHETSLTIVRKLSDLSTEDVALECKKLAEQVENVLREQGIDTGHCVTVWQADLRYRGQALSLPINFTLEDIKDKTFSSIEARFATMHNELFTFSHDLDIEVVNLRCVCEEITKPPITSALPVGSGAISDDALENITTIYYAGEEYTNVPVYQRTKLKAEDQLNGPCIVGETDSTTFISPMHQAEIDDVGNILIWRKSTPSMEDSMNQKEDVQIDFVAVELIEAALSNIRLEMDALIQRYVYHFLFRVLLTYGIGVSIDSEKLDYFPQIAVGTGPDSGKMVCGQFGSFIPGFLRSWDEDVNEGDVFITNDPYSCSKAISHLNDFLVLNPVHWRSKLIAWTANLGHFTDIGSHVAGSMPVGATSIHDDGVQIPLCALYTKGVPNKAVFKIIEHNSRKPDFARSDLQALVAATKIAGRRMQELCDRFGFSTYQAALSELLRRNKLSIGKLIKQIPNKSIFFEDWIDDDGQGVNALGPWRVACSMSKEVDGDYEVLVLDFEGTDPQSDHSINFALSHEMLKMFIEFYLLTVWDPATVVNDGAFDLIKINIPEGTILNPVFPAALSGRTHLLGRIFDVIGGLFAQLQPEFAAAAGFSDSPHLFYSGWTESGDWFQLYQISFGGVPARAIGDGPDGHSLWPSMQAVPNEFLEMYLPLRVDRYETIADSGGEGKFRGGNAMRIDYTFLEPGSISIHDDRWLTKPWGVHGGGTGQRSSKVLVKYSVGGDNAPRTVLGSKEDSVSVLKGDVLEWRTWGGGGLGNPLERDPQIVAKEVRRGLVKDASRYGVVLNEDNAVNVKATGMLRSQMQAVRDGQTKVMFNRGGSLKDILANAFEETGLKAPTLPSTRTLRGPVTKLADIQELHQRRGDEDAKLLA